MTDPWDEFRTRIAEHRAMEAAINSNVCVMARLIVGKLQSSGVNGDTLMKLKKELARYNIHTGEWRP